jgi:sulfatase modifying factor 1
MTFLLERTNVAASEPGVDGLKWVPSRTFTMGSDRPYPEEAPAHIL